MMRATVICDASFCPNQRVGAWAAWISLDGGRRVREKGPLIKQAPLNSTEAELMAAMNGLWVARREGAQEALLQSDCQAILLVIDKRSRSERLNSLWQHALQEYGLRNLSIRTRHVKGHTTIADSRSFVNRWCHENARQIMEDLRRGHTRCNR